MKLKTFIKLLPNKNMTLALLLCVFMFISGMYFINNFLIATYDSHSLTLKGEKLEKEYLKNEQKTVSNNSDSHNDSLKNKNQSEKQNEVNTQIYVYIAGEVKNPSVVKAKPGERLYQCLEKAGGATQNADLLEHNLAVKVKDGDKFIFKHKTMREENIGDSVEKSSAQNSDTRNLGAENLGKISLSKASKEELKSISGIGEKTAEKIIRFRKRNGDFKNIEELVNIEGIGHRLLNKIRDEIIP